MAKDSAPKDSEPKAQEQTNREGSSPEPQGKLRSVIGLSLLIGVIALGSGVGLALSQMLSPSRPQPEPEPPPSAPPKEPSADKQGTPQRFRYYDFEPILVNLNEARQSRYMRTAIKLAIAADEYDQAVQAIEARKPELKDWLIVHLSGCTLEDVAGDENKNRLKRRILDAFNEQIWPDRKPLIVKVILEEFAVQ